MTRAWALALIAGATLMAANTASAATLDFVLEASGNERGIDDGTVIAFDGLDVTFTSSHFAYFDDLSGGKPAGLGVCKVLTSVSKQCNPSNDDNVTVGESVTLSFMGAVDFDGLSFYNANHNSLNSSLKTLLIGVNGGTLGSTSFAAAVGTAFAAITSITFAYGGTNASQFYVGGATATAVPLPAAAGLMAAGLAGLGGLGALRRRSA